MKLAVFSDEVSQDLEVTVKLAMRYRLDGVELRTVWNKPVQHLSPSDVDRIRRLLGERELAVAAIASPVFKCELDDEAARRDHLDYLRSCIILAQQFDTSILRIFTFWKRGPSAPVWDRVKAQFRPAIAIARDAGITLAVENEHTTYCATAAETARFVREMDSPTVRVVWDPCNEIFADDGVTPFPDGYALVKDAVAHLHVKDGERDLSRGAAHVSRVGEGSIDWKGQFRDLLQAGYDGYASLETHWRPQALPESALNQPGGHGFSESGEYASDLCLRNMLAIIAEARRDQG